MKHRRWIIPVLLVSALGVPSVAQAEEAGTSTPTSVENTTTDENPSPITPDTDEEVPSPDDPGAEPPSPDPEPSEEPPSPVKPDPETPKTPENPTPQPEPEPGDLVRNPDPSPAPGSTVKPTNPETPKVKRSNLAIVKKKVARHVETLPATGASSDLVAGVGVGMLVLGAGFVALARKREVHRPKHLRGA